MYTDFQPEPRGPSALDKIGQVIENTCLNWQLAVISF